MSLTFSKATKQQAFLRLALEGPAGFGKTYTALTVGTRLAELAEKRLAFVDTEAGSASKYADLFDFDTLELHPPFHPDRVVEAIAGAQEAGYGVIVLDSLSHFWTGQGGMLELVDTIARTKYRGDSHRAWADAGEIQQRLIDAILRSNLHIVACMRTKKDYVRETHTDNDGRERTRIRPAGTKTVQRDEFDYEFDLVCRFDQPTIMAVLKSRCSTLPPETMIEKPGVDFANTLNAWLSAGEAVAPVDRSKLNAVLQYLAGLDSETDYPGVLDKASVKEHGRPLSQLSQLEIDDYTDRMTTHAEKLADALQAQDATQSGEGPNGGGDRGGRPAVDDDEGAGVASSPGPASSSSPDTASEGTPSGAGEGDGGEAPTGAAAPAPSEEPTQEAFPIPAAARKQTRKGAPA